jgi:hypothetical protein
MAFMEAAAMTLPSAWTPSSRARATPARTATRSRSRRRRRAVWNILKPTSGSSPSAWAPATPCDWSRPAALRPRPRRDHQPGRGLPDLRPVQAPPRGRRLPGRRPHQRANYGGDVARVRVALKVLEGAPAREGAEIADADGKVVGVVTSGGFGPVAAQHRAGLRAAGAGRPWARAESHRPRQAQAAEAVATPFVPTATSARNIA